MSEERRVRARLFSGASPEEVFADLAPLVDFQEEGLPLPALQALLDHYRERHP